MNGSNLDNELATLEGNDSLKPEVIEKLRELIQSSEYDDELQDLFKLTRDNTIAQRYLITKFLDNDSSNLIKYLTLTELKKALLKIYKEVVDLLDLGVRVSSDTNQTQSQVYSSDKALPNKNEVRMLDGLLDKQETFFEQIQEQGTTKYLVSEILKSSIGAVNRGKTSVEEHTIKNFLPKIFTTLTFLITLKKRVDTSAEHNQLLSEVDAFINKYVSEINKHLIIAAGEGEVLSIFGSISNFIEIFNKVMNEEASRTYREMGVKLLV